MSNGNPGTPTPATGQPAPAGEIKTECQNLDDKNTEERATIGTKTKNKTIVGANGKQEGTTVSSCKITPKQAGASSSVISGHSRGWAHEHMDGKFAKGGDEKTRKGEKSVLCGKNDVKHAPPYKQKSGHAEARILDEKIGSRGDPCKITLNINWRNKSGRLSKMPCEDCHKLICEAIACGHEIELCDKKGNPQPVTKQECPASDETYQTLLEKMGES
jgi:hypothetical protein